MKSLNKNSFIFPTPQKLILAIILFFVFGWIVWPLIIESIITDWYPVGFPFTIHAMGLCPPPGDCIDFRRHYHLCHFLFHSFRYLGNKLFAFMGWDFSLLVMSH